MKDYKNTRKEVEEFVNTKVLQNIKEKYENDKDMSNHISILNFLYSVGRKSALEVLIRLVLIDLVGTDDYAKLEEYFK